MDDTKDKAQIDTLLSDEVGLNEEVSVNTAETKDNDIILHSGNSLSVDDTYPITASCETKVIYLVGPFACGKTTIETSLYQLFHNGDVNGNFFAGSETLNAYEQRAFNTRVQSYNNIAETPRTPLDSNDIFLHLRLWNCLKNKTTNYLFADISGEIFSAVKGSVDEAKKQLPYIRSADYIMCIIDGEKIIDKRQRLAVVEEAKQLLRTFIDANMLKSDACIQFVFSKYDYILNSGTDEAIEFIESQKNKLRVYFADMASVIQFFNVAAMPKSTEQCEVGYGLKDVLASWESMPSAFMIESKIDVKAEINKLKYKLLGGHDE